MRETEYANLPEDETGAISPQQKQAVINALQEHQDVRWTFLLMHKAPWSGAGIAAWRDIEKLLIGRPHTVFHGHRHAYHYEQRNGGDYIRLATTGGVKLPDNGPAMDHLLWVTVDREGVHIANLKMTGILNTRGEIPGRGAEPCLGSGDCPQAP